MALVISFTPVNIEFKQLYNCSYCGAIVQKTVTHRAWHNQQEQK